MPQMYAGADMGRRLLLWSHLEGREVLGTPRAFSSNRDSIHGERPGTAAVQVTVDNGVCREKLRRTN